MSPDHPLNTATLLPETATPDESTADALEVATMDPERVVSTYADTLMAGLFGDLDRLLEGDEDALTAVEAELKAPPSSAESAIQPSTTPELSTQPEVDPVAPTDAALTAPATALAPVTEVVAPAAPGPKTTLGRWFDRLLLACTALSLTGVVVLLWQGQRPDPSPDVAGDSAAAQSDAEFLAYLQRSLDVIEQQVAQQPQSDPTQSPAPWPNAALLPPVGFPSQSLDANLPGRINVIERVYIPYQTTPPALPGAPSAAPPALAVPPTAGSQPAPSVTSPVPGVPTPSQPATPGVTHVLVGVLELGDRSAALFDINGVSQRVYIGERIGNAGWSLVSVSNQEAVIRRNGEVRSIFIGQQF